MFPYSMSVKNLHILTLGLFHHTHVVQTFNHYALYNYSSIILKLYSPRYPVNITFQGAAAQLSHIFRVLFVTF